jgi:DNA-binding IclR family transcriptional regulator
MAVTILEVVGGARHGLTAAEIAKACRLSPQGAQRLRTPLADLCHHRYLWRWDTGRYTLGPAVVERFADFATQQRDLRKTGSCLTDVGRRPACLLKYLLSRGVCTCGVRHRPRRSR